MRIEYYRIIEYCNLIICISDLLWVILFCVFNEFIVNWIKLNIVFICLIYVDFVVGIN